MPKMVTLLLADILTRDRAEGTSYLIDALRSGKPLPPELASLIADMLDPGADTPWRLKIEKRGAGAKRTRHIDDRSREAEAFIHEKLVVLGAPRRAVIDDVAKLFGFKKSKAYDLAKEVERTHALLTDEQDESPNS